MVNAKQSRAAEYTKSVFVGEVMEAVTIATF